VRQRREHFNTFAISVRLPSNNFRG